jgi:acetoin utilization protein AcuB
MMARSIPPVADRMTTVPRFLAPHETVRTARALMAREGIRHLPVLDGDKLVGVISERDLRFAAQLPSAEGDALAVEQVMVRKPHTVRSETPLNEAARVMAERRLGSVVVVDGKKVIGILTTTDALAALVDLLEGKLARSDFERAALGPLRPKTRQPTREARR